MHYGKYQGLKTQLLNKSHTSSSRKEEARKSERTRQMQESRQKSNSSEIPDRGKMSDILLPFDAQRTISKKRALFQTGGRCHISYSLRCTKNHKQNGYPASLWCTKNHKQNVHCLVCGELPMVTTVYRHVYCCLYLKRINDTGWLDNIDPFRTGTFHTVSVFCYHCE